MSPHLFGLVMMASGCLITDEMLRAYIDRDNDGHYAVGFLGDGRAWPDGDDCDDDDPAINPERMEICQDRVDNDCDGEVDEDGVGDHAVYADRDRDGFGNPAESTEMCAPRAGWVLDANDCNDLNELVNPVVPEACDKIDNDCDGVIDDGAPETPWLRDGDGDGFGDPSDVVSSCQAPPGYTSPDLTLDCDDASELVFPGAYDAPYDGVDADCAKDNDYDVDHDGFLHASSGTTLVDCDDVEPSIHPGALEVWYDGVDQDCDPETEWDMDRDGAAVIPRGEDCDDADALRHPGAAETWYDAVDQDCDPATEWDQDGDGLTVALAPAGSADDCDDRDPAIGGPPVWYLDLDQDGWGDAARSVGACTQPAGYVSRSGDCDDLARRTNPDGVETCGAGDEDCDGEEDESGGVAWYPDVDGDGYGDAHAAGYVACQGPQGFVSRAGDCDDRRGDVSPAGVEVCDGVDDDCDGSNDTIQGRDLRVDLWRDADGDGVGAVGDPFHGCREQHPDTSRRTGDCDDADPSVFPGAAEPCDGVDNNCAEGLRDEGRVDLWLDGDADGYGAGEVMWVCPGEVTGVGRAGDCDDADPAIHPGAVEVCDHVDNDCVDGVDRVDGRDLYVQRYEDADGDQWGSGPASPVCPGAAGWVVQAGDCDDGDGDVFPGAPEPCNGIDDNCEQGTRDEGQLDHLRDEDGDGFGAGESLLACPGTLGEGWVTAGGDCDDTRVEVHPGAVEACNYVDDNCNGDADELALRVPHWRDDDGDSYGGEPTPQPACDLPGDGLVRRGGDCDDADPAAYPRAPERCDPVDQDCDGDISDDGRQTWYVDVDVDGVGGPRPAGYPAGAPYPPVVCRSLLPSGWAWTTVSGDCDDHDPSVRPGVVERCDYVDANCNGFSDERTQAHWPDVDGDGKGDAAVPSVERCPGTPGYVQNQLDCDDGDPQVFVGAPELCDEVDQDCDGDVSDDGRRRWWYDGDGDGYGVDRAGLSPRDVCQHLLPDPQRWVTRGGDCDDANANRSPGHPEVCDTIDNDCNAATPEPRRAQYPDRDGDGYGQVGAAATLRCDYPGDAWVDDHTDCDDRRNDVHPGAADPCDEVDQDCDGDPREGQGTLALIDVDHDGYGDGTSLATVVCPVDLCLLTDTVRGQVVDGGRGPDVPCWAPLASDPAMYDCDDDDHATHPEAAEVCDGKRNTCRAADQIDPQSECNSVSRFEWNGSVYQLYGSMSWSLAEAKCREIGYKMWWPDERVTFLFYTEWEPWWLAAGRYLVYAGAGRVYHAGIRSGCPAEHPPAGTPEVLVNTWYFWNPGASGDGRCVEVDPVIQSVMSLPDPLDTSNVVNLSMYESSVTAGSPEYFASATGPLQSGYALCELDN
ncbi:MAG TPA: putative metal-binding motif-containing protein [Myxococcota bacterium]|nr:putative metal-binding motif-containing protein [Myxococcota bacterium]